MLKKLKIKLLILLTSFIMPISILAYSDYIIPGGENIGIEIKSKGVMVVGLYEINGKYLTSDLKVGDLITKINDQKVETIDDMTKIIGSSNESIKINYIRNNKEETTTLNLVKDENNIYKTGLYVKDEIKGIGTLTFIDPSTKLFGALGHEIIEKSTGKILEVKDGKIYNSKVTNIDPSRDGNPGEKNAVFKDEIGKIKENTNKGIFGEYKEKLPEKKKYKVATQNEIKTGEAKILTVLNDEEVKEYKIEILKISDKNEKTKNLLFEITDKELLETTGGIVQGMSGSPIIQDDFIIGAVTHVVVDSPTKGYGIFITNMLEEAEN